MTSHRAAAQAALAAAKALPGESTRDQLLLEAITHAVLALGTPEPEPQESAPLSRGEQVLAVIRREGGQWDGQRLVAACRVAGIAGLGDLNRARGQLRDLTDAGHLMKVSEPRAKPVYELAAQ